MAAAADAVACSAAPTSGAADEEKSPWPPVPVPVPAQGGSSLLFASLGDPKKGFLGHCASVAPDWRGERIRGWPGRHAEVCAPFREGTLRSERLSEERGRSLVAAVAVAKGEAVCHAQPALALHQYSESRQVCEVCAHCHHFVGSLRSALAKPLLSGAKGAEGQTLEALVEEAAFLEELEAEEWRHRPRLPCPEGCGEVFCSAECQAAARKEGWHRVLCTDLPPEKRRLWTLFRKHANKHHELFVLAAQVIAEIICLVRHSDASLYEAMAFFTRFAKMSWLSMLHLPSRSHTQGVPLKGPLVALARKKVELRLEIVTGALQLLAGMLWERQFAELLTVDFFSNLVGQFALSNVWVQREHPLAARFRARMKEDPEFRCKFGRLAEASRRASREIAAEEADAPPGETANASESWALPQFQASGLYVCCALSNHSCRPNFAMRYGDDKRCTMVALRDIQPGEELNLAYVSPTYELTERLTSLWRHWGFVCTCEKCQDELMERALRLGKGANEFGLLLSPAGAKAIGGMIRQKLEDVATSCDVPEDPLAAVGRPRPVVAEAADTAGAAKLSEGSAGDAGRGPVFKPAARLAAAAAGIREAHAQLEASAAVAGEAGDGEAQEGAESSEEEDASSSGESDEEDASDDDSGAEREVFEANPNAPQGVPPSVLRLEADLRRLMASMQEMEPARAG